MFKHDSVARLGCLVSLVMMHFRRYIKLLIRQCKIWFVVSMKYVGASAKEGEVSESKILFVELVTPFFS